MRGDARDTLNENQNEERKADLVVRLAPHGHTGALDARHAEGKANDNERDGEELNGSVRREPGKLGAAVASDQSAERSKEEPSDGHEDLQRSKAV